MSKSSCLGNLFVDNNVLYSFSKEYNLLSIINCDTHCLDDVKVLPDEEIINEGLVSHMMKWRDLLVIVPNNAKSVYLLDKTGVRAIHLAGYLNENIKNKFGNCCIQDNILFLFGHWAPVILGIDLASERIVFKYDIPEEFQRAKQLLNDAYFGGCCALDGKAYLPFLSGGYLVEFDFKSFDVKWTLINERDKGYSNIALRNNGDFILFRRRGGGAVVTNTFYKVKDTLFNNMDFYYCSGVLENNSELIMTVFGEGVYLLNPDVDSCSLKYRAKCRGVSNVSNDGFYYINGDELVHFNLTDLQIKTIACDFSVLNEMIDKNVEGSDLMTDNILVEDDIVTLKTFIKLI